MKRVKEFFSLIVVFIKQVWILTKRVFESSQISEVEYRDLAPIENVEDCEEHIKALRWAFGNRRIKNVALTGPYGAGKSSIISTFLERNPVISDQSIRLSLATFSDMTGEESKTIVLNIEEGILKQLFYKVKQSDIPQSRFRKIERIRFWKIFGICLLCSLAALWLVFVFTYQKAMEICQTILASGVNLKAILMRFWPQLDNIVVSDEVAGGLAMAVVISFFLLGIAFVAKLIQKRSIRLTIKGDKLPVETTIGQAETNGESIFDKHIDELLYFFEVTKYRYVFIEDLDRFNDPSIFVKLRELNALLNNYDAIKERIVFVYAIGDDMFQGTERTKFFDFIIPVIPVINSTNSGEILQQKLQSNSAGKSKHNISRGYILDIAPFISDMRILQNICNEFLLYKTTLTTQQKLELHDEPMLSLIVFKNLFPTEFAELQSEKGSVKKAFLDKSVYLRAKSNELREKIIQKTSILQGLENDTLRNANELKSALLCELTGWKGMVHSFGTYNVDYVARSIFDENFDTARLKSNTAKRLNYHSFQGNSSYMQPLPNHDEIVARYIQRLECLRHSEQEQREAIKTEIAELETEARSLTSYSLEHLISEFGVDEVIVSNEVKKNSVLVFMLRKGYIHEGYADYMNFFKGNSISTEDMNFILAIKNQKPLDYQYSLNKTAQVLERLQPYEFKEKAILNVDLLEFMLLHSEYDQELKIMIQQLANGSDESWNFIELFVDLTTCQQRFIQMLSESWPGMWNKIYSHGTLTYDRKTKYLVLLLSHCGIERLVEQNIDGCMVRFFESHSDILQRLPVEQGEKIKSLISALEISFRKLDIAHVQPDWLDYVFDGNYYELNAAMIYSVVEHKNKDLCGDLKTKNYTTILTLGYEPLIKYVHRNLACYVESVVLSEKNTQEDIAAIAQLVMRAIHNHELCEKIITHEEFCAASIWDMYYGKRQRVTEEVQFVWDTVLKQGKVRISWKNVYAYWCELNLTTVLLQCIDKNADVLSDSKSDMLDDAFKRDVITSDISANAFGCVRSCLQMSKFDVVLKEIAKDKLTLMIQNCDFAFTTADYAELNEYMPEMCATFIMKNQDEYEKVMAEVELTADVFEELVLRVDLRKSLKESVVNQNSKLLMTDTVASAMHKIDVRVSVETFWIVWEKLTETKKQREFFYSHYRSIGIDDVEKCFQSLGYPLNKLLRNGSRHKEYIPDTNEHRKLVEWLKTIRYLTSIEFATQQVGSGHHIREVPVIACWVKAK